MSAWVLVPVLVWHTGFTLTLGVLAERERLLNPDGERGVAWAVALVFSSALWFVFVWLWPTSRPVPPQPPGDAHDGYLGAVSQGVYIHPRDVPPLDARAVDRPGSLALCGAVQVGERVWVKSLGLVLTRGQMFWYADCQCRYNFAGFPVVLCWQHRTDVDPQGEPDESEGEVGR